MKTKRNYLFRYLVPVILAIFLMTTVGSCKSKSGISSIAISPLSANIKEGTTQQFTAIGTYNDGSTADITKQVTWISSDTSIASISNIGLATGVALGSTHITASLSGVISPVVILQVSTKALSSIKLTPTSPDNFAVGAKQQFTATGTYDDGSVADISLQVTWSSSNTSVAKISSSGLVTAVGVGTSSITASAAGITSPLVTATVVVATSTPILKSITITPSTPSHLVVGSTQQFTAVGTYSDGSTRDITNEVEWMSDTPIAVTINASGLATAVAPGTANITAFFSAVMSPKVVLTVVDVTAFNTINTFQSTILGTYIVDGKGITLYWTTADTPGQSNVTGSGIAIWPVFYTQTISVPSTLNVSDFGSITRADGSKQTTFKNWPLYYFASDTAPGDTKGHGVGGKWSVVNPAAPGPQPITTTTTTVTTQTTTTNGGY